MNLTDQQLIEKHLALKAHIDERTAALEAELKPYKDGMAVIENALLDRLNERGSQNTKTDAGTAYKSEIMSAKVVDRSAFLQVCMDAWDSFGADMLDVRATKDAVRQFVIDNGSPPPGLELSYRTNINIRRS